VHFWGGGSEIQEQRRTKSALCQISGNLITETAFWRQLPEWGPIRRVLRRRAPPPRPQPRRLATPGVGAPPSAPGFSSPRRQGRSFAQCDCLYLPPGLRHQDLGTGPPVPTGRIRARSRPRSPLCRCRPRCGWCSSWGPDSAI
jgi:hypothetical protein